MVKLNILNMKEFLQVVDRCIGDVNIIYPDGRKENINNCDGIQWTLQKEYRKNRNSLPISLDIPNHKDYLSIVYYAIGDY